MTLIIINYIVKILIIVIGIILLSGVFFKNSPDQTMLRIMGAIFILWGIYRIIIYRSKLKRYREVNEDEED